MKAVRFLLGVLFAIAAGVSLIVLMLAMTGDDGSLRIGNARSDRAVLVVVAVITALTLIGALTMGLGRSAKSGWRSIWCLVPLALVVGFWFAPDTTAAAADTANRVMEALPGLWERIRTVTDHLPGIAEVAWQWTVVAGTVAVDWTIITIDTLGEWIESARVWVDTQMAQEPQAN